MIKALFAGGLVPFGRDRPLKRGMRWVRGTRKPDIVGKQCGTGACMLGRHMGDGGQQYDEALLYVFEKGWSGPRETRSVRADSGDVLGVITPENAACIDAMPNNRESARFKRLRRSVPRGADARRAIPASIVSLSVG